MRRIKDEEERKRLLQRGQELSEQYEKNRQAVHQAEAQTIKNSKVHWVDPTATGFKGVTNRIGWIGRNAKAGGEKSLLDTLSAFGQTTQVGLQRGANQAAQEQTTWDKIKNYGKNALKSYAYTSPDMISKILYMSTIGRQDAINENNQVANQIAQNYSQAQTGFGKFGAIAGGVTSKVFQDSNALLQGIYAGGQQVGQILGEDRTNQTIENMNKLDTKLHEKNDKELEELRREGTLYDGVTRKLGETGQTVGYMTPSIAIGLVTGGAGEAVGLAQMGLAAKGSTTREAMQQGADLETAERKGVASGTAEALSEKMFGGLKAFKPFKESGVEDVAKKYIAETIEKRISSQLGQGIAKTAGNWLVDVTGETIEELTTDIYNTWLDQATTDPNAQYTLDDAINTAVGTALSTTVLNVGYTGLNKGIQKVYDRNQARANNQESIPEAERTESNGYKENLQEMVNNLDIPEEAKAQIQPMLDSNATINAEEYKDITNNIKTLVKANTQQQIADYGAELTTQYNAIEEQRQSLDNIKPENFKDQESRKFYAQQLNKEFSDSTIDNILTMYPENRNGNRTVKQYKEIAKEYGKQMALNGLTFDEVRANTVGAWQYYEPNKNITRYDNQQKKNASFERLNSQVWSEEVYNSYKDTMRTQLQQQQEALSTQMNDELTRLQDEENILIDTIDNLKPRATAEQVAKTKKLVEDFAKARGVNVEYNAEVFKNNNEEAFIKDNGNGERTIYINPNADPDTILVKLATHEMFHDTIRTQPHDKLTKLVMDRLKADENYNTYRESVREAYQEQLEGKTQAEQDAIIDEEMTAKYLGEYLGDEQFVQQLVNSTNRSTIQRIVDWIDNRLEQLKNIVTGNREAEYWRKVRENFVKAYNEEYASEEGEYYSRVLADGNEQLGIEGFNNVQNGQLTIDGLEQQNNEQNFEQESIDDLQQTNTQQVNEQTEEKPIEQPKVPTRERIQKTTTRIEDFGEKIGMARKDLAMERGTRRNPNKEVTHEYTVMSSEEFNDRMSKSPIVFMGERQQINGYGVFFKGKLLTDGFNTPQQAEEFISTFKENLKSNMAYVESGTARDGTENYLVYLRNPRNLRDRLYSGKSFTNKQEAESYAMALSIYLKDHGKNLFRPQIQKIERVNPNVKNATKTTGDNILNDFGFRGGEFGNWVTNTERQEFLNYAEDGLTDLAEALGVEKDSLGQNGQMAIAFGARGKGLTGAVAHFEPDRKVINMTRLKGAGSLAHEYGHSIDNYLSRINGYNENGLATETNDVYLRKLPENVKKAIDNVVDKLKYSTSTNQEDIDKKNNLYEKRRIESLEYNLNDMDRIFAGKSTTYKKIKGKYEVVPIEVTEKQAKQYQKIRETLMKGEVTGSTTFEDVKDRYGIRTEVRYPEPISTLQSLYKEVVGRKLNDDTVRSLYMRGKPVQQVREVKSESAYSKSARELDKLMGRSTLYHATTPEMWARAFEAYVYDKLKAKGITDNYLVSSVNNEDYALFNPFPGGEERANINKAFDELLDVMKQEGYFKGKEDIKYSKKTTFDDYLKEQSKIKDEKGNLLNVYHTTNADFDTFDRSKIGSTTDEGIWGKGFYFSNKPADYGSNKLTANLYISNPFVINDFKTPSEMADFLDMSESNFYKDNSIGAIRPSYSQINQFTAHLMERGYDGVVVKHDNGFTEYVAFNPEQINIVNKENTDATKDNNKDNQGRTLTKEQQEYFKDSKVRDENGNLITVYHGTEANIDKPQEYWFTIFDKNSQGIHGSMFGDGFYFTSNKEAAQNYAHSRGNVYETYLNIKNPYAPFEDPNIPDGSTYYDALRINFSELSNYKGRIPGDVISDTLKKYGYDGIILDNDYIAFESNQIKNVDNLNPTENEDIRYNINSQAYDDYLKANNPNRSGVTLGDLQQRLPVNQPKTTQLPTTKKTQTISSTIEEPTLKVPVPKGETGTQQKVAKVLSEPITKVKPEQRAWALFKANILDKGAVFEDLSFKAKNRELQAKWDSTLLADAKGQNAIGQARYEFENGEEKQVSKALTDIIDEVGENSEDFNNYMYHQLNIDRMTLEDRFDIANKPVFGDGIDANYSRQKVAELEKAHPEFKEYAQDVYDYLDTNKKELVDNGVISQETSDKFKEMYPHYVPIARIDAKGQAINVPLDTNRTGVNSPIKKAKGGSQDIQPLFQTIADRTMQTYKASSRNSFGLELKNTLDNLGMFNQLETTTENADNENLFEYDGEKGNLTEGTKYQNPTFTVFENGEKVTYEINQDMYDALRPKNELFSKWDNTKLMKMTRKINDIRRGILTEYNPVFSITNAIKDAQDAFINSQHWSKTYAKFPEAYSQILKKGYWYKEYVQNGGSQNSYFTDGDFVKQDSKAKSIIKMPLEAISKVNNVIEMAPRLAEYIASREQGKSIQSAMLDASRVTTNFKAGGDVTKFLNRNGATFLNASVQGLQQNIRNIREANAKGLKGYGVLLGKAVIAGLPALILNNLVWRDDDDYEELQDYVKDNYYIIAKIGDHKFLRIPKGRTVAVIQKAVTNMSDFITNKDEIDPDKYSEVIWGDLKDTFELASNNLAPNNPIENNIVSPIVQAVSNKTWYGEDLVPSRLKDKPNEEKYDESTAEISKQISGVLNKIGINSNPMQINYLLDQYGGGVSDVFLPMGTPQAENNMLEDKFTTDSVMKSRYPGEFFEQKDKLAVNRNSSKATDEDELLYKYANSVSGELSDLYQEKREIQNSSLTDKEKKKQIAEVQKQINSITEKALQDLKEPKIKDNTATIGNTEYIKTLNAKTGENEWKKLTDKTKIEGVSLKTQADYENRLAKYKQKTGDTQLSDKEETQIILDGNYTSQEKKAIYLSTTGKKDDLYKAVSNNMNIDEYLGYKTANIQGTKDSSGKTISGTKKTAQLDYINNNISGYENRLLLMGKDYKLSRSQQQDLAEYIYTLDNADDLFAMYDKNFTVRDGTVYYK